MKLLESAFSHLALLFHSRLCIRILVIFKAKLPQHFRSQTTFSIQTDNKLKCRYCRMFPLTHKFSSCLFLKKALSIINILHSCNLILWITLSEILYDDRGRTSMTKHPSKKELWFKEWQETVMFHIQSWLQWKFSCWAPETGWTGRGRKGWRR